jgi:hypothetical protein
MEEEPVTEELEGIDEAELDTLDGDELDEDVLADVVDVDDDDLADAEVDEVDDVVVLTAEPGAVVERPAEKSEDEDEDEDEADDEDVEASLDVILKERLVVEDEPDDEEPADVEDRSELTERVLPKQPDEFVCRSCFLVKHPSQLADKKKMLCRDCV